MAKVLTETVAGIIPFPAGMVMAFAGSTPPPGWLPCDGSLLSRTTYAVLFAVIGTGWGSGDGSTTFHLPDLRGRFLRGVDGAAGRDPNSGTRTAANAGGNTGNAVGSVQANATAVNGLANAPSALTATAAAQLWTYGLASGTATAIDLAHTHSTPALTLGVTQSVTSGDIPHLHAAGTLSVGTGITGSVANTDLTHTHGVGALVNAPSLVTGVTGNVTGGSYNVGAILLYGSGTFQVGGVQPNIVDNTTRTPLTDPTFTQTGSGSAAAQVISGSTAVSAPSGLGVAVIHNHGAGGLLLTSGAVANSTANNTGSIAHTHDINHTHPANNTGAASTSLIHLHGAGTLALTSGAVANSTANNTGSIAHTHDINHTHPADNTGAASVSLSHTHPVTGVTGTNVTSAVSGSAAAQALSGDAETRPLNANVNYIIKT